MRRFLIFHAWLAQVPEGTAAEDLPALVGDHAISRLSINVPDHLARFDGIDSPLTRLACHGLLWEEGLGPDDSLSFIQEVV